MRVYSRAMRLRPRKHRSGTIAAVAVAPMLLGVGLGAPGTAIGTPQSATPDPGSPAGTEYALPFDAGRGIGSGGSHHGGGGAAPFDRESTRLNSRHPVISDA